MEVASQNTLWDVMGGSAVDETGMKPWFQTQFKGRGAERLVVVKNQTEDGILAITGATISSQAVTGSVRRGLELLMSIVNGTGNVPCEAAPEDMGASGGEGGGAAVDGGPGDAATAGEAIPIGEGDVR
jgi:hypothetical protein